MLSDKIFEKIKEEKIEPKPKWNFLLKNYLVWLSGILFLIIGSLSFATIIFNVRNNDWDLLSFMPSGLFKFIFLTFPYFWLVFLFIFGFIIYYNFKHTKKGYKYSFYTVIIGIIFASVVFGSLFYNVGFGYAFENFVSQKIPAYEKYLNPKIRFWNQPKRGLLLGEIENIDNEEFLEIKNIKGEIWKIKKENFKNNFKRGDKVKMIGRQIKEKTFEASEFRPFHPPARGLMKRFIK